MDIEYCATEDMVADFYTKPLQDKQFYMLRNLIMGCSESTVQECVENNDKMTTVNNAKRTVRKITVGYMMLNTESVATLMNGNIEVIILT